MERVESGELTLELLKLKPKTQPKVDWRGELLVSNEMCVVRDYKFASDDPRHKVAKTHRHITDKGLPGASGKYDPKTISTPDGVRYLLLNPAVDVCSLCVNGDMIPLAERFRDSVYRP